MLRNCLNGDSFIDIIKNLKKDINNIEIPTIKPRKEKTFQARIVLIERHVKMMCAGFSRPYHLLFFAIDESIYNQLQIDTTSWDVNNELVS